MINIHADFSQIEKGIKRKDKNEDEYPQKYSKFSWLIYIAGQGPPLASDTVLYCDLLYGFSPDFLFGL